MYFLLEENWRALELQIINSFRKHQPDSESVLSSSSNQLS